jgi:predicted Zn finger-like uncharacterized protein
MKFVCDRCLTKYSIADDKVRGRILKIRCKSCSNIITVKESAPTPISVTVAESDRTVITSGPIGTRPSPSSPTGPPPPRPPPARAKAEPGRPTRPPTPPSAAPSVDDIQWFMAVEGVQKGPFARKVLVDKLAALARNSDVHIWNDTLDGWKPPVDVPVIARELQARQRHTAAPTPPPPPAARLRPVPPPPSQAAGRGLSHPPHGAPAGAGHGGSSAALQVHAAHGGAGSTAATAHAHGQGHGQAQAHAHGRTTGSHSALSLGLAHVAPAPAPASHPAHPPSAADGGSPLDTPAPIRELVQTHRANGEARISGAHALAASAAPHAMANGESDALQALNLGQSWRQPGPPLVTAERSSTAAAMAAAFPGRQSQRNRKLAIGFVALVVVCVGVSLIAFKKPPTSASAANPPLAPGGGRAVVAKAPEAPKPTKDLPAPGGEPPQAAGEGDPAAGSKAETVARISSGKKPLRPGAGRTLAARGGSATAPGAFTPEQRAAEAARNAEASRYGDSSLRPLQLRGITPSVARVAPNQGDITRVVNTNKGGIKICYQRALLRDSSLTHGKIDVEVSIGISGRVKNVAINGPAAFRSLDPCIKDVLSRWVFPASSEEYGTGFSYLFQGNE